MKYNTLIPNSTLVSEIGLGAWQLGVNSGWQNMTEAEAVKLVHTALDLGINFFDTAPNYGEGTSEVRLGLALKKIDRDHIIINTKFGHTDEGIINYDSKNIQQSLEKSLKRLQVDYVDSFILHNPPFSYLDGNKNDHYEILERLKEQGKIKAYGASLDTYKEIELLLNTTNSKVIEVFFNILHQDAARAFNMAMEKSVGVIVKIPLDSGWLTGKYDEHSIFSGIRKRWSRADIKTRAILVDRIKDLIRPETNLAQVAISFCLAYDAVSTVIPGNINAEQLAQNMASISTPISKELLKKLEAFYEDEVRGLNLPL
jgi:aryl-alcohol dehydrogenase-like predicted oxidoreductase